MSKESITQQIKRKKLDGNKKSDLIQFLEKKLKEQVIGQEESSEAIADCMSKAIAGIRNKEKPILTMMFLGCTGTGKTQSVKVLADIIFGTREGFTRINCEELTAEHSVAKLIGSPPGYVGNEIEAMLSQKSIDKPFLESQKWGYGIFSTDNPISKRYNNEKGECLSIILFDEIEKAHPKVWNSLIGIMDDGHLSLGNNKVVNLKNSIIIMTSNVGARELDKNLQDKFMGFDVGLDNTEEKEKAKDRMKSDAINCVKDFFPPEFCNRFDKIITFNMLTKEDYEKILNIQIEGIYKRMNEAGVPIFIHYKPELLNMLLEKGIDNRYGARNLNRTIEDEIITPLSKLINTEQIESGDMIEIYIEDGKSAFIREPRFTQQMLPRSRKKNND